MKTPYLKAFVCLFAALMLSSCAGPGIKPSANQPISAGLERSNIYHTLAPGETLWRVSKMYDVDIEVLKKVNRIRNVSDVEIGTRVYVPGAAPRREVLTFYPSSKWQFIVIHHSATDSGSSQSFNVIHKKKGWDSVGYHFVIDNGTCGKEDGQIEPTPRWTNQLDGAHCKAGGMNMKAIGICLVGNFSSGDRVSARQMKSLTYLVKQLMTYYKIPQSKILGHSQVPGAKTECPGYKFPWTEFKSRI